MFESILCQVTDYDPEIVESLIGLVDSQPPGRPPGEPPSYHQPQSPPHRQGIGATGRCVCGERAGIAIAACRYLDAAAASIELPLGLGSRHIAAAHISLATRAVGIVLSESIVVRLFCHCAMIGEIIPGLWMLKRYDFQAVGRW